MEVVVSIDDYVDMHREWKLWSVSMAEINFWLCLNSHTRDRQPQKIDVLLALTAGRAPMQSLVVAPSRAGYPARILHQILT